MTDFYNEYPPPFNWLDVHGKTLRIVVAAEDGDVLVMGYDEATKKQYILVWDKCKHDLQPISRNYDKCTKCGARQ